jgi:small GTP-binding protein
MDLETMGKRPQGKNDAGEHESRAVLELEAADGVLNPVPGFTLRSILPGSSRIFRIAWSPDGERLALPCKDGTIRIWDVKRMECLALLKGHSATVSGAAWSPKSERLATCSSDNTIRIWNVKTWKSLYRLKGHKDWVKSVAWSPDGQYLASGSNDATIRIWDAKTWETATILSGHKDYVQSVAWSPNGQKLASGSVDHTVNIWNPKKGSLEQTLKGHSDSIPCIIWSPNSTTVFSCSYDGSIRIWDAETGKSTKVLEAHTNWVDYLSISAEGDLLASKSSDETIRIWRTDIWETIAILKEKHPLERDTIPSIAFHPKVPRLATLGDGDTIVRIWDIDKNRLFRCKPISGPIHYTTAKLVLVGDSGVGKTGLGWRLAHNEYKKQDSTHGQQFWLLKQLHARRKDGTECEAVLWDLAGQPDYRLIHSLFLDDADLALVLFNPANPVDPLHGVDYWIKSLSHRSTDPCKMILVGARCDVGDPTLTRHEIENFCKDHNICGGYVRTSAKKCEGIDELIERMKAEINWDEITSTTTTATFKRIKEFVLELKEEPNMISVLTDWINLRESLEALDDRWSFSDDEMKTAVGHLAKHGYVRIIRTSTGEQRILLVPELLNNLAASFILEARRNPKGLGSLDEQRILNNDYHFKELKNLKEEECNILLDAAMVLFIEHNIAFRETHVQSSYIIFPQLINQKTPSLEEVETIEDVSYKVSGSIENVYSALVVLLGYTNIFVRTDQWHDQAQYEVGRKEICGFRQVEEKEGEVNFVLYYSRNVSSSNRDAFRGLFERFLSQRNVTVVRFSPLICKKCGYHLERVEVIKRTLKGSGFIYCNECGEKIEILKEGEEIALSDKDRRLIEQEQAMANTRTRFEAALTQVLSYVRGRRHKFKPPSCFISYAWGVPEHEQWVEKRLARDLRSAGIDVILDRWDNAEVGSDLPRFVSRIEKSDSIVVVGTQLYLKKYENKLSSTGSIVASEVDLIHQRLIGKEKQKKTVRPVILDGNEKKSLPPLMRGKIHADFQKEDSYFASLFDLILSIYGIPFDDLAVADLREELQSPRKNPEGKNPLKVLQGSAVKSNIQ